MPPFHLPLSLRRFVPSLDLFLIGVLFYLFWSLIWGLGITHTDDALWALAAHTPGADVVGDWAKNQGRLWAYPVGRLLLSTLSRQGRLSGELMRLGGFAFFFVPFFFMMGRIAGMRLAKLAALLFFGLACLRWEGSILTTYPQLSWIALGLFSLSVLSARAFVGSGKKLALAGSCLFFFGALFNNEGVSALVVVGSFGALLFHALTLDPAGPRLRALLGPCRSRTLFVGLASCLALYVALAYGWLTWHPTTYDGHHLAPFDFLRFWDTLLHFATNGSILHDAFALPYRTIYADLITSAGTTVSYPPSVFDNQLPFDREALALGVIAALAAALLLTRKKDAQPDAQEGGLGTLFAVTMGLAVALIPLIPVCLTAKYQNWHFDQHIMAYSHTALAHAGLCLAAAGVLIELFRRLSGSTLRLALRFVFIALLTAGLGYGAALANAENRAIRHDMQQETGRWHVLDQTMRLLPSLGQKIDLLWAPRFANGSWFTVVPASYWSNLLAHRYQQNLRLITTAPRRDDLANGLAMLDDVPLDDGRRFIIYLASFDPKARETPVINKILLLTERLDPSFLASTILAYEDETGRVVQTKLTDLPCRDAKAGIYGLENVKIKPGSIRLQTQTFPTGVAWDS